MRIGVLTSVERRHRYFVHALRDHFHVMAVGYEQTGYSHPRISTADLTADEAKIVADHFAERSRREELFFGANVDFAADGESCAVRHLAAGTLNSDETLAFLEGAAVDTVVVFGTNLLKRSLLMRWPGRMINMHLGLSPYYRGTATNFYALLNEEPECVGATIHLLDQGIDSGPILRHARPEIAADDCPHTIGCKAILRGIEAFVAVLKDLENGSLKAVPQWKVSNAHLYLRKDYHPRQVVELHRKIKGGLIRRYVERAPRVSGRLRLME